MGSYFFDSADLTGVRNHIRFLQSLPDFTRSLKVNLDLIAAHEYGKLKIPEIESTLSQAHVHAQSWSMLLPELYSLHDRLETFSNDVLQRAVTALDGSGEVSALMEYASKKQESLIESLEEHEKRLEVLIKGVYYVGPRIIDFINGNVYRHARLHKLVLPGTGTNSALQSLTYALSVPISAPRGSAAARLEGARRYSLIAQGAYACAFDAATNLAHHLARLWDIVWAALGHIVQVKRLKNQKPDLELQLMLVKMNEILRLARQYKALRK